MPTAFDHNLLPRCTRLIEPRWTSPAEREAWIDQAFYGVESRLHTQLDLTGASFVCCTRVIKTLLAFGCLRPQQHALARLLSVMRPYAGVQDHVEFDALIGLLDPQCAEPVQPSTPVLVTAPPPRLFRR